MPGQLRLLRRRPLLAALAILMTMAGCAGGTLSKVGGEGELPKDLPTDIKQKFEVTDASAPAPIPSPAPEAAAAPAETRRKKKLKPKPKSKDPAATPAAIEYPDRRPKRDPIWVGEKQTYEITYLGMAAGDFTLTVLPLKSMNNRTVYHVKGHAESSKLFSLFYRLDDWIETFVDYQGLFSHRFHILLDESKQTRDSLELYDSEKEQTFFWNRWNRKDRPFIETKEFHPMPAFPQDSLSALYYLRTLPLPTGAVISFPVVNEGKSWEAVVTVVRRELLDTAIGRVPTIVLKPETKYQGMAQKRGDSFVWLTDDDRRLLVRLDAKVKIGTIVGQIKSFEPGSPGTPGAPEPASGPARP